MPPPPQDWLVDFYMSLPENCVLIKRLLGISERRQGHMRCHLLCGLKGTPPPQYTTCVLVCVGVRASVWCLRALDMCMQCIGTYIRVRLCLCE